jgi:hypothetical protein
MQRDPKVPTVTDAGKRRRSSQEQRLADQLRQNLVRRKAQTRSRAVSARTEPEPGPVRRAPREPG